MEAYPKPKNVETVEALSVPARQQIDHGGDGVERQVVVTDHLEAEAVDVEIDPDKYAAQSVGHVVKYI